MNLNLIISEAIFVLLHLMVIAITFVYRRKITCMVGMMVAMTIGMTAGLGLGTLLSALYPNQIFESTVISMLVGSMMGATCGLAISLMAVLDGLLAGLMAGMMGTMLGSMISPEYFLSLIKIVATILSTVIFILIMMLEGEIRGDLASEKKQHFTILFLFTIILTFWFFIFHSNLPSSIHKNMEYSMQHDHSEKIVPEVAKLHIEAQEFTLTPSILQVKKGESIEITFNNSGKIGHELQISQTNFHIRANPKTNTKSTIRFDSTGTYEAFCAVPGHKDKGMIAIIKVS